MSGFTPCKRCGKDIDAGLCTCVPIPCKHRFDPNEVGFPIGGGVVEYFCAMCQKKLFSRPLDDDPRALIKLGELLNSWREDEDV